MDRQYNMGLIFFIYGLAFFCMGLAITLEANRGSDMRLRHGLRALAIFGILHGIHEWLDMFEQLNLLPGHELNLVAWHTVRIALLEFSFLFLAAFGATLLPRVKNFSRASILVPLALTAIWGMGIVIVRSSLTIDTGLWNVADVWTRYAVAVPAGLLACLGLLGQRRTFREAGLEQFGRAALLAALAFAIYSLIGQTFVRASALPPSTLVNEDLFLRTFGFPVQLLRAGAAVVSAWAVVRFLRSFEVEAQHKIAELQAVQLHEAQRREALHGKLLRQVVSAQEAERQRVARELHDATGQSLTAIGLGLRGVSNVLRLDVDKAAGHLRQIEGLVARALDDLQRLIADLRPSHLDDLGLPAALRWYAGEVQSRAPLVVTVEISGEPRPIDPTANTALFRVAQEALTNVLKHARATHAAVRLSYLPTVVTLQVVDNGQGFEAHAPTPRPTWGLLGMEERATLLGGYMAVQSQPGHGACVEMTVPYHPQAEIGNDNTAAPR